MKAKACEEMIMFELQPSLGQIVFEAPLIQIVSNFEEELKLMAAKKHEQIKGSPQN